MLPQICPELAKFSPEIIRQLIIHGKYEAYIKLQEADLKALRKDEAIAIPSDFDFAQIGSLSNEIREKLTRLKPLNLAQAGRISGVTPAALMALLIALKKQAMVKSKKKSNLAKAG